MLQLLGSGDGVAFEPDPTTAPLCLDISLCVVDYQRLYLVNGTSSSLGSITFDSRDAESYMIDSDPY